MLRVMHNEQSLSEIFIKFLLIRGMRIQSDLVDQLFNSSEKRLARILLLMAESREPGKFEDLIPQITQETLADMIGTTRSRVSFFMNRFRKLGFISYNGRIQVRRALLNAILHDQLPGDNAAKPTIIDIPRRQSTSAALPVVHHYRLNILMAFRGPSRGIPVVTDAGVPSQHVREDSFIFEHVGDQTGAFMNVKECPVAGPFPVSLCRRPPGRDAVERSTRSR